MDIDLAGVEALIRDIPDFPAPGVLFKDITPVLANPAALDFVVRDLAMAFSDDEIEVVVGIEARGFILATPVAIEMGIGFVPIRKPGKLPHAVETETYDLEYGTDTLEVHTDAIEPGQRVLIVDDVIATGGTAAAAIRLIERLGGQVAGIAVFIDLAFLGGKAKLGEAPFHASVRYD
ncbi:MAG TPA: adenine phosphoribosyltransferase [Actinobacteria bacterium]|nr:adenine phosphoribosyltransferase [Actinomycetota bacterium]